MFYWRSGEVLLKKLYTAEALLKNLLIQQAIMFICFFFRLLYGPPRLKRRFEELTRTKSEEAPATRLRVTYLGQKTASRFVVRIGLLIATVCVTRQFSSVRIEPPPTEATPANPEEMAPPVEPVASEDVDVASEDVDDVAERRGA